MMPNNDRPDGFKETEIGPIPVDWEVVPLGSLARVKYGKAKPKQEGVIPVVGSGGIYGWVNETLVDFPTLVIGRKGTAGRAWLMDKPCWPSDTTFYLEWTKEVDIHFLFGYLTLNPLSGEHAKTTLPSLSRPDLESYLIPLPPLPQQRRIAHVLSTIQRAIAAQDDLIAAAREVKRSLMQRLFTYGPGPEPAATKETEIGEIPEHWEVVRLGDVLQTTQYGLSVRADRTGTYPMLRMNNLADGRIDASDLKYVDLDEDDFAKFHVHKRDVLFNRTNSYELVGKTAIFDIEGDFVFASYLIRVVPDAAQLLPEYLNYYLNWDDAQRRLKMLATRGVSQSNISATKLKRFTIGLPLPAEQQEIARMLSAMDRKIAAEEQRKAALQALFKAMLHQLMTGKLRLKDVDVETSEVWETSEV